VQDIIITDYKNAFRVEATQNSTFDNIDILRSHLAFVVDNYEDNDDVELGVSKNLIISNINLLQYRKRGLEFKDSVTNVVVNNLVADATLGDPNWITTTHTVGVELDRDLTFPPNANMIFDGVKSINNTIQIVKRKTGYQQGDGFSIEDTSYGLEFYNSISYNNTDGGWDDKSFRPYYENVASLRNKRNFRFWNDSTIWTSEETGIDTTDGPVRMKNILAAYSRDLDFSNPGIHTKTSIDVDGATFYNNFNWPIEVDENDSAVITVRNSILWADVCPVDPDDPVNPDGSTKYVLVEHKDSDKETNINMAENNYTCANHSSLQLQNPRQDWTGDLPSDFDPVNPSLPGYRSTN